MKRTLAIVMVAVMLLCVPMTALAAVSPTGEPTHPDPGQQITVVVVLYDGDNPVAHTYTFSGSTVEEGAKPIEFEAETIVEKEGKSDPFEKWIIYTKSGEVAVEGRDYIIVESTEEGGKVIIKIIPYTDVIVTANYKSGKTDVTKAIEVMKEELKKTHKSDKTGDVAAVGMAAVLTVALAGICVSKKKLAK